MAVIPAEIPILSCNERFAVKIALRTTSEYYRRPSIYYFLCELQ